MIIKVWCPKRKSFRTTLNRKQHVDMVEMITLVCLVLLAVICIDPTSALSDVNVTKFEFIDSPVLSTLPEVQCEERDVPTGRPVESCVFKSSLKKVFVIGFNTTTCYLCYANSSYSKMNLTNIQNVNWYASQGK